MFDRALRAILADLRLHLLSVFSVSVAFICLCATLLLTVNIDAVRTSFAEMGRASIYLDVDASIEDIDAIKGALSSAGGVSEVRYISSEQARSEILATSNDVALAALPPEAFPASIESDGGYVGARAS